MELFTNHMRNLLLASPFTEDVEYFRRVFLGTAWSLYQADSLDEARRLLHAGRSISVVVADHRICGDWRDLLEETVGSPGSPRLIIAAHHPCDWLWAEVMNLGGQDVLAKPFNEGEIWYCIESAWRSWASAGQER